MHRRMAGLMGVPGLLATALCAVALLSGPALARGGAGRGGGVDSTYLLTMADGEGTLRRDPDRTFRVDHVIVDLSRNGQVSIRLRGLEFTGTWRRRGGNTVALTLLTGFNTAWVKGSGTLELKDNRRVRSLSMEGWKGAERFDISFTAAGRKRPGD